jgi:acetyltransferase-like isoleucine patch superfamily enzyme
LDRVTDVFIHPQALVESASIGRGTRIWAFAHVMNGAVVGRECNICDHSFIESKVKIGDAVTIKNGVALWDKVTIEDRVFIGPYAVFTNDRRPRAGIKKEHEQLVATLVREGATVGANATIVAGVTIGRSFCTTFQSRQWLSATLPVLSVMSASAAKRSTRISGASAVSDSPTCVAIDFRGREFLLLVYTGETGCCAGSRGQIRAGFEGMRKLS